MTAAPEILPLERPGTAYLWSSKPHSELRIHVREILANRRQAISAEIAAITGQTRNHITTLLLAMEKDRMVKAVGLAPAAGKPRREIIWALRCDPRKSIRNDQGQQPAL